MNKLFLPICVIFCLLFSCQSEEIVSSNSQTGSRKSNAVAEAEISSLSKSSISDPNYIEPNDPGNGGTGGGDVNFIMPPPIAIDNGQPLVLSGNNGSTFTLSGGADADLIGFTTSEQGVERPLIIVQNARGLWMGFSFVVNGTRFFVRAYTVAVYNGQIHYWVDPRSVDVLVMSAALTVGEHYKPATWSISGKLIGPGYFDCQGCSPVGQAQGTLSISQLSVNAQGKITLNATVTVLGKTYSVVRNNWNRWH